MFIRRAGECTKVCMSRPIYLFFWGAVTPPHTIPPYSQWLWYLHSPPRPGFYTFLGKGWGNGALSVEDRRSLIYIKEYVNDEINA